MGEEKVVGLGACGLGLLRGRIFWFRLLLQPQPRPNPPPPYLSFFSSPPQDLPAPPQNPSNNTIVMWRSWAQNRLCSPICWLLARAFFNKLKRLTVGRCFPQSVCLLAARLVHQPGMRNLRCTTLCISTVRCWESLCFDRLHDGGVVALRAKIKQNQCESVSQETFTT